MEIGVQCGAVDKKTTSGWPVVMVAVSRRTPHCKSIYYAPNNKGQCTRSFVTPRPARRPASSDVERLGVVLLSTKKAAVSYCR